MHPKQKQKTLYLSVAFAPAFDKRKPKPFHVELEWGSKSKKTKQSGQTHGLKGAVAGKLVDRQRRGALLTRRDELIQEGTGVRVMAGAHLLHAGHLHPETSHLLLHSHVHLGAEGSEGGGGGGK